MAGSILEAAKADAKKYVTSGGVEEDITISTPAGDISLQIRGLATKHHINFTSDGLPVNSKNAHVCIDEQVLSDANYPVRNNNQEISLKKHRISFPDSSGVVKNYIIKEHFPDETFGLIVCILEDFNNGS